MPKAAAISRVVVSCSSGMAIVLMCGVIGWTVTSVFSASTRHAFTSPVILRLKKRSVRSTSIGGGLPFIVSKVSGCAPLAKKPVANSCMLMRKFAADKATRAGARPCPTSSLKLNSRIYSMRLSSHGPYKRPRSCCSKIVRPSTSLTRTVSGASTCKPTTRWPPVAGSSFKAKAAPLMHNDASISNIRRDRCCGNGHSTALPRVSCMVNGTAAIELARICTAR